MGLRVLVLGSGGRESALAWALARSPSVSEVAAAPGNPGIAHLGATRPVDPADAPAVLAAARAVEADLVVVGPEAPLVAGVADALRDAGFAVFGPGAAAARIEGSKAYAKELMADAGVPTAAGRAFRSAADAVAFLDELGAPYVVKADGLAAGKGVVVTVDRGEAVAAIEERLVAGRFGDAGRTVVIEEYLEGEEASLIAFSDGRTVVACEPAQDYKRAHDGDRGPNTGGMGSYSPVPSCPPDLAAQLTEEVMAPVVAATARRGAPFVGALYAGLVLGPRGARVLEFNARFGDPETQALLPRLASDFAEACAACAAGELEGTKIEWRPEPCVAVVIASGGYPGPHRTGCPIEGLEEAASEPAVEIFHAGTELRDGRVVTAGGRVLAVSALGKSFAAARSRAYAAAARIRFDDAHLRSDIGERAVEVDA
jgi:phosphoribosylamine--glycine ligase